VVSGTTITVGWVGDSRAYWLPDPGPDSGADSGTAGLAAQTVRREAGPLCLTTDDSLAGQLAAAGIPVAAAPQAGPATALVRWLGADAQDTEPHLVSIRPERSGRVLVCSDGLFRYLPTAAELAAAAVQDPPGTPLALAQMLVRLALDAGGQDNVSVAVLPFPAP
jgi:serine/threonine protein phosphatase PrpC